ncbi:MAG: autotransporter domain-containing protein [Candidatus Pseudomonas phytovorans]|uniref:Autotransporter domain-containing protein n=1 Tax=Candidatus Pseudomonas phytovorans TaxID=3121377 RepID=A0AAJ6BCI7_9PSED|nr:autotransporter outer membrane beta-barrel domain-containing protein [Pseudomonas sp.]WEK32585.1 MAG: autotransporter domain-containing protein [Pseudomonas sp.]
MYFKQSLLAVAVSIAYVSAAYATDGKVITSTNFPNGFTNSTEATGSGDNSIGLHLLDVVVGDRQAENAGLYNGNIINSATVTASGVDSSAMTIEQTPRPDFYKVMAGSLTNKSNIQAVGEGSTGLHLSGAVLGGVVQNDGVISGGGVGLDLDSTRNADLDPKNSLPSWVQSIDNAGVIEGVSADGLSGRGILVDGVNFTNPEKGITNSGTIRGGEIGIDLDQFTMNPSDYNLPPVDNERLQINADSGLIQGGSYAIYGAEGRADLNIGEVGSDELSSIVGNINGIDRILVRGNGLIDASLIEADRLRISENATLTLAAVHTTLDGDFNLMSGATLGLPLSVETQTGKPVLTVTGTADLASGSTVVINAKGTDFAQGGANYDLISAQTLNIAPDVVIKSSSSLLTVNSSTLADGTLNIKVTGVGDEETGSVIESGGGDATVQGAGQSFMSVAELLAQNSPNDPVLKALMAAGSDAQAIANVAKQFTPEVNGGAASAANSSITLVNNAISSRSSNLRAGQSSGDLLSGTGAWFQILSSQANQDVRSGVEGYDANSRGFALGADHKLNGNTVLGVAYSYVKTNVESDNGNKTDVENNTLTAYGTWTEGNYFVDGGLSYGKGKNDSKRYISGTTAKGSYDSDMIGLNVMAGYGFHFDHNLLVEPRVTARYTNLSIDGFSEHGSSAALKTGDQRLEVGELGAGLRVAGAFDLGKGTLEPEFKVMAYHDLIADKSSTTSAFTLGGNSFVATGVTPARNSYEAGIGVNYKLGAVTIGGSYERLMKTGFDADAFTAKVRYDF